MHEYIVMSKYTSFTPINKYYRFNGFILKLRHVFEKHGCPGGNKVKIWQDLLSPKFDPAPPLGACDVSEV